jgi:hypothetical protein
MKNAAAGGNRIAICGRAGGRKERKKKLVRFSGGTVLGWDGNTHDNEADV